MKVLFSVFRNHKNHSILAIILLSVIALLLSSATAHAPINWNGDQIHVLLDKEGTGGDMGMFTVEVAGPSGSPLHVHESAGEAFYILDGSAEVLIGTDLHVANVGESIYVPKGVEHGFRLLGEHGGKLLVVVTPAGFEGFFEATKHLVIPEDMDEINRISAEFDQIITGPPMGSE